MPSIRYVQLLVSVALLSLGASVAAAETVDPLAPAESMHRWNAAINEILREDGFPPTRASRVFAYANIAAYEAARGGYPEFRSFAGQLNGLDRLPQPEPGVEYDWRISAITAYKGIIDRTLYRIAQADTMYAEEIRTLSRQLPQAVVTRSQRHGEAVVAAVERWMAADGYREMIAGPDWEIPEYLGAWEPTPPDFKDPVDPFWHKIRPFVLDSANQFVPDPPVPFSTDTASEFYRAAMQVYEAVNNVTAEQELSAQFWDCNPLYSHHYGHLMFASRQISPGGHWINITSIAARKRSLNMIESLEAYALVSVALADAFISCWTEKYRTNVIRPVTYINRYIDPEWRPLLQTPPFPEHSSGHSTISAAASIVLTQIFGTMEFDDDTETYLGLPVRTFGSFIEAADDAAMSRLWGGIHYVAANEAGKKNGKRIAKHVLSAVATR